MYYVVGLGLKDDKGKRKKRERKKPVVLLENDQELPQSSMEVRKLVVLLPFSHHTSLLLGAG